MALSKSPKSLEERVQENAEVKAHKRRETRLAQKRNAEARRRERKRAEEEQRKADEKSEEFITSGRWRDVLHENLSCPGEWIANVDVVNINQALIVADRWCAVLGLPLLDESVLARELRVAEEWVRVGRPFLSVDGKLSLHIEENENTPFDPTKYIALPGSDRVTAPVPAETKVKSPPKYIPTLVRKRPSAPETKIESIPNSTGHSGDAAGAPPMTFQEERNLALKKDFDAECAALARVKQQIEQSNF